MEHQSPLETFPPAVNRSILSFRCSRKIPTATTVVHNPSTSSQNFPKRFGNDKQPSQETMRAE